MLQSQRLTKHVLHVFFPFLWKVRPLSSGHPKVLWHRDRVHEGRVDPEYIPQLTEQELIQWLQYVKMSTHNTSWKIRGFSSVDMTSQTQIFFFFFKEGSQAWWRRLVIPAVQRWKEESKAILGYTAMSRPLWDIWDSITNKQTNKKEGARTLGDTTEVHY